MSEKPWYLRGMLRKKPRVVSLDEVKITRKGDAVDFEYADSAMGGMHLTLGFDVSTKTDAELLDCHNDVVRQMEQSAAEYEHVAVEVPVGRPQVKYHARGYKWSPRGDVLRCLVHDGGPDAEATVEIDDREFSLAEFGQMLTTYAGWGMRIVFVPDQEIHLEPTIEVREPDDDSDHEPPLPEEPEPVLDGPWLSAMAEPRRAPPDVKEQHKLRKPVYRLRVTLVGSEPPIWREVLVSGNRNLKKIHEIIQIAMGWTNSHLHTFSSVDGDDVVSDPRFGLDDTRDEGRVKLRSFAPDAGGRFSYEYDMGDSWEHEVVVQEILAPEDAGRIPRCVAGARACPPEDCGGIGGYFDLVAAMKDKRHPERRRYLEWLGGEYDPELFDLVAVNRELARVK